MKEKTKYVKADEELIKLFKSHKEPYRIVLLGKEWCILPNVFSPKYAPDTKYFAEWLPDIKGKTFLEVGCGAGLIAVEAALMGASKVVAIDINKDAVENTKLNAKMHNVYAIVEARLGNLFDPINPNERFDIIFFNLPFLYRNSPQKEIIEKSVFDYIYQTQKRFLKDAKKYLSKGGEVIIGFSTIGHVGALKENARGFGYKIEESFSKKITDMEGTHKFKFYRLRPK